ncbi:protein tilB homolog isoform X2 [Thrips palmi]|uniref:Protein tilB homolog isoform X2 n=1 Tax=Thrips palmi TaxID=161013 RepID=A0A6P9A2L3_THRPL|nr:protein tilB homolog isoform X2 [Thrips palmi]
MVRITAELVKKRSEHNEGEISTLEELSLHQEDIEKIENLQNWCRELRILLLQSNLISKLENLNKMKRLEYLNLALNNIERIENLERCESLEKLDLTLNFIGELTSVASLISNVHLHTLHLTGNPCAEFSGYRDYVVATLPQLQVLDSEPILRSDRIKAIQNYHKTSELIIRQQDQYAAKRAAQKQEHHEKKLNSCEIRHYDDPEEMKKYWDEVCDNSPETRIEMASLSRKQKAYDRHQKGENEYGEQKRPVKLFKDDGQPLSVNEPRVPFTLSENDTNNCLVLTIEVYRHLDISHIDANVEPSYVRVTIKGKIFQIVLPEAVHPDKSTAQRSQTTGHLVISMPMVKEVKCTDKSLSKTEKTSKTSLLPSGTNSKREYLEIGRGETSMDFSRIGEMLPKQMTGSCLLDGVNKVRQIHEKPVSDLFQENTEVPPLE